ncbi:DUF917 domain-containing protein [Peribacillus glennii]|uniref:DUF917 domain-containing protein n=1 Tax=Peribacillus glennii TaxID=2303991 RepID=A0A372LFU0_9BACI|nr:DUF917 domain-containing protein [Peribacillus glennii]RFU65150.1 DUF917 domain-containing protein [Peribacillus glennii]
MATLIGEQEIEDLAIGAAILGTGGGGDPYIGKLMVQIAIRKFGPITLLAPHELPDEALIIPTAAMGAPTVSIEKIPNGMEGYNALRALEKYLGKSAYATMPIECGGGNSTIPFVVAAHAGIPVVDADGMGRAFPELQMETFHIYGIKGSPMVIHNELGDHCILNTKDNLSLERFARAITVKMGATSHLAEYPMTGKQVKEVAITGTLSLAIRIGKAIREARMHKENPIEAIIDVTTNSIYGPAMVLFQGKVTGVDRQTRDGFVRGMIQVQGFDKYQGSTLEVDFQNENLIARMDGEVVAMVPDLITLLDLETGLPITTEAIKYGSRVTALAIPTPEIMRTPQALEVWGPRYFGYDVDYRLLEEIHPEYYKQKFKVSEEAEPLEL